MAWMVSPAHRAAYAIVVLLLLVAVFRGFDRREAPHLAPPTRVVPTRTCLHYDEPYACGSIFDAAHYARSAAALGLHAPSGSDAAALAHFVAEGLLAGASPHAGPRVAKVLVMTKDEWPLVRAWVLHHAYLLGPENVIVLDASTNADVLAFLDDARRRLGVVVLRSRVGLLGIDKEINDIMNNLAHSCDFFFKFDTDEFLVPTAVVDGNRVPSADRESLLRQLEALPFDGRYFKLGPMGASQPNVECSATEDPVQAAPMGTVMAGPVLSKIFFNTWSFSSVSFGFHEGALLPQFAKHSPMLTEVGLAHYHFRCYEARVKVTKTVLVSLGLINADDSLEQQLAKCLAFDEASAGRTKCPIPACHKGWIYVDHLKDPVGERARFYKNREWGGNVVPWTAMPKLAVALEKSFREHGTLVP